MLGILTPHKTTSLASEEAALIVVFRGRDWSSGCSGRCPSLGGVATVIHEADLAVEAPPPDLNIGQLAPLLSRCTHAR